MHEEMLGLQRQADRSKPDPHPAHLHPRALCQGKLGWAEGVRVCMHV
eukprot:COSAG01_NODE_2130_length_8363_cov_5.120523_3_plen_47_part_00